MGLLTDGGTGPARSASLSLRNRSLSAATPVEPGHAIPFAPRCSDSAVEGTTKNSGTGMPSWASRASVAAFAPTDSRAKAATLARLAHEGIPVKIGRAHV